MKRIAGTFFSVVLAMQLVLAMNPSAASAATLYSTISSTCTGYGMSANSLRTVIPFSSPVGANLTGLDLKFSSNTNATSMTVKIYSTNPTVAGATLLGSFTYSSISGSTVSYSGNLTLPSAATYWLYFQTPVNNTPCFAWNPETTGSTSGWVSGGRASESFNSGTSWTQRSDDVSFLFSIYGTGLVSDTTPPTFTSSTSFSAAENIATSATAATIKVSESATVTISGGSDSAAFNIYFSDSVTAIIKFNASPNYEAPTDVGGNNVYEITLTATDAAANPGTQSITITVTDVVDTSGFNSLALAGSATSATYRTVVVITANITVASKVTFRVNGKILPGCKNKSTTGSSPNIVATCTWKPSNRGNVSLTAGAVPTGAGISSTTSSPVSIMVGKRVGSR
jgi:hypothetical protein